MDLLRLPLVVLTQIFKNMNFRTKFFISLLSKRAKNTLRVTSTATHFSALITDELNIRWGHCTWDNYIYASDTGNFCIGGETIRVGYNSNGLVVSNRSVRNQLLLVGHVLDTFPKATFTVALYDPDQPVTTLEFLKMINQRKLPIKTMYYMLTSSSSELRSEILDECAEVTDDIIIHSGFVDGFVYNHSRLFRAADLGLYRQTPWFNLESFLNCRYVSVQLVEHSKWNSQYWRTFFTSWMDSDAPLQRLELHSMEESETRLVLDELSKLGILQKITDEMIEMKRESGSEFFVYHNPNYIDIYTKQAYLENLEKIEQRERDRKRLDDLRNNRIQLE